MLELLLPLLLLLMPVPSEPWRALLVAACQSGMQQHRV